MFISVECFPIWCMQEVNRFINLCITIIHISVIKSPFSKTGGVGLKSKYINIYICKYIRGKFFTDSFYLYIHANKYIQYFLLLY